VADPWTVPRASAFSALVFVAACAGTPARGEDEARRALGEVEDRLRPGGGPPPLPTLTAASPLADHLRFALLNSPRVAAAYHGWAAEVARITLARSRPDPRLTFQMDIASMIASLMPGLMTDLPGPGKLAAAGEAAVAASVASYHAFRLEVLRVALATKSAYYRLHFLEDSLRVQRATLALLDELEALAQQQNAAGRVTLQDVLRAQIEKEQVRTAIANLEDSRVPLRAEWKAALGLGAGDPDPPVPAGFTPSPDPGDPEALQQSVLAHNPVLSRMAAEVRRASAMLDLAGRAGVPDFALGVESDLRASPVMWRPSVSVTLPIWRDKIAAAIAAAQADRGAAAAQLDAEQIALTVEVASLLFVVRETARTIDLLEQRLVPMGRQSLVAARTAYTAARAGFLDVLDAERQLLAFETTLIDARTRRELALATLSSTIAGIAPAGAPLPDSARQADRGER
jgi:outer membrane protein TolC